MSHRTNDINSYLNSLRWSLRDAVRGCTGKSRRSKVCLGAWTIAAPTWELPQGVKPHNLVEFSCELEFGIDEYETLWFELEYLHFDRVNGNAVYKARCEI